MTDNVTHGRVATTPSNVPAIISIVAGLLICLPATGAIAIPAALLGFRRARKIGGVGVVPARVGLVMGIINLVWWSALLAGAFGTYRAYVASKPTFAPTKQFIMLVGSGNVSGAKALCTSAITDDQLTTSAEQIQRWGTIENINVMYGGEYHGPADIEINAELKFEKQTKYLIAHWAMIEGSPQLTAYHFRDPPTTQPTADGMATTRKTG